MANNKRRNSLVNTGQRKTTKKQKADKAKSKAMRMQKDSEKRNARRNRAAVKLTATRYVKTRHRWNGCRVFSNGSQISVRGVRMERGTVEGFLEWFANIREENHRKSSNSCSTLRNNQGHGCWYLSNGSQISMTRITRIHLTIAVLSFRAMDLGLLS